MRNDISTTIFYNFCDNFFSHTHIIFLLSLSIVLVFVSMLHFLCKMLVVTKVVTCMDVQITQLKLNWYFFYAKQLIWSLFSCRGKCVV